MEGNTIGNVAPPTEAENFDAPQSLIITGPPDNPDKQVRFIFYNVQFSAYEQENLSKLQAWIEENQIRIPDHVDTQDLLRFLYASEFKLKKCIPALQKFIEWKEANVLNGYVSMMPKVEHLLQTGGAYIHGRDCYYRPIFIMNINRMLETGRPIKEYIDYVCFYLSFMIDQMLIPGKIENWFIISDLCNRSIFKLPVKQLKNIISSLKTVYRCRVVTNYIVNAPSTISVAWKVAKKFLDEISVRKISINSECNNSRMFEHVNPCQLEEKYGGTAPNVTQFWPPVMPDGPYGIGENSA